MAKTAGVINGTDLIISISGTHPIAKSTTCGLQFTTEMRDCTNKDTAGWKAFLPGVKTWQMSAEMLFCFDQTYNGAYLTAAQIAKTLFTLYFKTSNTDNEYFYGTAYITSCQMNAGTEANVSFTVQFQGTGALTLYTPTVVTPPPGPIIINAELTFLGTSKTIVNKLDNNLFAGIPNGSTISVTGTVSNNGSYTTVTNLPTIGGDQAITVAESLTDEIAPSATLILISVPA